MIRDDVDPWEWCGCYGDRQQWWIHVVRTWRCCIVFSSVSHTGCLHTSFLFSSSSRPPCSSHRSLHWYSHCTAAMADTLLGYCRNLSPNSILYMAQVFPCVNYSCVNWHCLSQPHGQLHRCDMQPSQVIEDYRLSQNKAFPLVKCIGW